MPDNTMPNDLTTITSPRIDITYHVNSGGGICVAAYKQCGNAAATLLHMSNEILHQNGGFPVSITETTDDDEPLIDHEQQGDSGNESSINGSTRRCSSTLVVCVVVFIITAIAITLPTSMSSDNNIPPTNDSACRVRRDVRFAPTTAAHGYITSLYLPLVASVPLTTLRVAFHNNGKYFRGPIAAAGPHLASSFAIVEYDANLLDLWIICSYPGDCDPRGYNSTMRQKKIFFSAEPYDMSSLVGYDAIADTKLNPFMRPPCTIGLYLPYYVTAQYELGYFIAKRNVRDIAARADQLTNRSFAVYMQHSCISFREKFFDVLSTYKRSDAVSICKHNMSPDYKPPGSEHSWKSSALVYAGYKFALVMENSMHSGYITEKIVTAIMAETIPIYIGAPDIADHFNEDSFVHVLNFPSLHDALQRIIYLDNNDTAYMEVLQRPLLTSNNHWTSQSPTENYFIRQMIALKDTLMATEPANDTFS